MRRQKKAAWVKLTCHNDERGETAERRHVQVQAMQTLRELHDGVDPLAKSSHTLRTVENHTVAEDQFVRLRL